MHGPIDQWPGQDRESVSGHLQRVAERDSVRSRFDPVVAVKPIETLGAGEPERDGLPRYVFLNEGPDRAMSAARANADRAVELRAWPRALWPEENQ